MRTPLPRVDRKRKLVCAYSTSLNMFEVRKVTSRGIVSKMFAPQKAFTDDIREAFRRFEGIPFAGFRSVPKVNKRKCTSWNAYIEAVWAAAN